VIDRLEVGADRLDVLESTRLLSPRRAAPKVRTLQVEGEPPKMTRSILIVILIGAFLCVLSGSGCSAGGVGDPCIPEQEYDVCFAGFDEMEVNVESKSFQCLTRVCLVNHFQGRVSCPYGQTASTSLLPATSQCGAVPGGDPVPTYPGTPTCTIPGGSSVLGKNVTLDDAYQVQVAVLPQVHPRVTAKAVYCSCRCENANGQTDDGSIYCQCPEGYYCKQLVTSLGTTFSDQGLTGGYCILGTAAGAPDDTAYNPADMAEQSNCAPSPPAQACPLPQ
jgi:hypothetical protein